MNLLFDEEDKENFQKRVESAFQFRFYCETLLKRSARLEKKDLEKVPPIPTGIHELRIRYKYLIGVEMVNKIIGMVKSAANRPLPKTLSPNKIKSATDTKKWTSSSAAMEKLVEEAKLLYKRMNKKIEYP